MAEALLNPTYEAAAAREMITFAERRAEYAKSQLLGKAALDWESYLRVHAEYCAACDIRDGLTAIYEEKFNR